ncbi:MAG: hypothetical protein IT165_08430 [Bryobacterales bacterium]|nr:hypothetical protein [Bryobacterales bacterium]
MRKRKTYNPKRKLCGRAQAMERRAALQALGVQPNYTGNPEHKRNPGDFGLQPPSAPRLGKTLCDDLQLDSRSEALRLLREGFHRGLFSVQERGGWPQNVWAVTDDGYPVEAQLDGNGSYHGYPMPEDDPLREFVLDRWNAQGEACR